MSSIFDTVFGKIDLTDEIHRLAQLFEEDINCYIIYYNNEYFYDDLSLEKFIDDKCFADWKGRGTCRSLDEFKKACGLAKIREETSLDESKATRYLEYLVNMIHLFEHNRNSYDNFYNRYTKNKLYKVMRDNIDYILSQLNLREYKIPREDFEAYEIVPAKAEVCEAIKVIDNRDIKLDILEYNHISIRNDLAAKRKILSSLYKDFESKREKLQMDGYKSIGSDLGFLFNNLDIRHNNIDGKNANSIIRDMPDAKKMELYDQCYQLYVTAVLIYEYITKHKAEILKLKSPTG